MSLTAQFTSMNNCLVATARGTAESVDHLTDYVRALLAEAAAGGHTRLLLDETGVAMTLDTLEVIHLANRLEDLHVASMGIRMAVVCAPANCGIMRSMETALRNRSINYQVFDARAEAEAWLLA